MTWKIPHVNKNGRPLFILKNDKVGEPYTLSTDIVSWHNPKDDCNPIFFFIFHYYFLSVYINFVKVFMMIMLYIVQSLLCKSHGMWNITCTTSNCLWKYFWIFKLIYSLIQEVGDRFLLMTSKFAKFLDYFNKR